MRIFRVALDENFDADLIARIDERANGASPNEAIKFLLRYWFEGESRHGLYKIYTNDDQIMHTSLPNGDTDGEPDWSELDEEF